MKHIFKYLLIVLPSFIMAQHSIKGTFSPAKDYKIALLYKVTPTISEYVGNAKINEDGTFELKLDATAPKGMYRLVYAVPQEDYNFDIIYNGKEDVELKFNSETGVEFLSSIENTLLTSYTNSMSNITHSIGNYFSSKDQDTLALSKIFAIQKETQSNFEEAAKDFVVLDFIKANKPYIPDGYQDVMTYVENLKNHYFDFVDFTNETLQSSNFLEEKMVSYVFGMTTNAEDEIANFKNNIDAVGEAMSKAPNEVKRILLISLWQQLADLKKEAVANYVSQKYLMDVLVALNDQELINELLVFENVSLGKVAPNFTVEFEAEGKKIAKNLEELDLATNYVIVFWSSTCSHCLDEIPQLQKFVRPKDEVKVIAVGLEDEPDTWNRLTQQFPEFIHVYGKGKWDNEIGNNYAVTETPTYFVLDKDKKIISKPENLEDLKKFFEEV